MSSLLTRAWTWAWNSGADLGNFVIIVPCTGAVALRDLGCVTVVVVDLGQDQAGQAKHAQGVAPDVPPSVDPVTYWVPQGQGEASPELLPALDFAWRLAAEQRPPVLRISEIPHCRSPKFPR